LARKGNHMIMYRPAGYGRFMNWNPLDNNQSYHTTYAVTNAQPNMSIPLWQIGLIGLGGLFLGYLIWRNNK